MAVRHWVMASMVSEINDHVWSTCWPILSMLQNL